MRRAIVVLAVVAICASPVDSAAARSREVGRGHLAMAGPWTDLRSLSVMTDRDTIDGFFLRAPKAGTLIGTRTKDHSGTGFDVNLNFRSGKVRGSGPRPWLGGCATSAPNERRCRVPAGAGTVEVTGRKGLDLDVVVFVEAR